MPFDRWRLYTPNPETERWAVVSVIIAIALYVPVFLITVIYFKANDVICTVFLFPIVIISLVAGYFISKPVYRVEADESLLTTTTGVVP